MTDQLITFSAQSGPRLVLDRKGIELLNKIAGEPDVLRTEKSYLSSFGALSGAEVERRMKKVAL